MKDLFQLKKLLPMAASTSFKKRICDVKKVGALRGGVIWRREAGSVRSIGEGIKCAASSCHTLCSCMYMYMHVFIS